MTAVRLEDWWCIVEVPIGGCIGEDEISGIEMEDP